MCIRDRVLSLCQICLLVNLVAKFKPRLTQDAAFCGIPQNTLCILKTERLRFHSVSLPCYKRQVNCLAGCL